MSNSSLYFSGAFGEVSAATSPLVIPIINQSLPGGLLHDLAIKYYGDFESFKLIFTPLLRGLWQKMRSGSLLENHHRPPLVALEHLCEIRITSGGATVRPFAQLIAEQV
jgi:hypothetical protein